MSFSRPAHFTFASRVGGWGGRVQQRAGPQCEALAMRWDIVTNADWCHSEGTREQEC